jgi:MFS family permease
MDPPDRPGRQALLVAGVMAAVGVSLVIDSTIASMAVRVVGEALDGLTELVWLSVASLLVQTITMPVVGKLADAKGRKGFVLIGLAVLTAGSFAATAVQSVPQLAAVRAFQGIGWGMTLPPLTAIFQDAIPPKRRGRYVGPLSAVSFGAGLAAPVIGGAVLGAGRIAGIAPWRVTMVLSVPLTMAAFVAIACLLPRRPRLPIRKIDWLGSLTLAWMVAPGVTLLARLRQWDWADWPPYALAAASGVGVAAFAWAVRRQGPDSITPPAMLRSPAFRFGLPFWALYHAVVGGLAVVLPLYWLIGRGLTPLAAGFIPLAGSVGGLLGSFAESNFMAVTGRYRIQSLIGVAGVGGCAAALALAGRAAPIWALVAVLFTNGLAGAFIASFEISLLRSVPPTQYSTAAGTVLLAKTVGMTAGSALMMGLLFAVAPGMINDRLAADGLSLPGGGSFDLAETSSLPGLPENVRVSIETGFSAAVGVALVPCVVVMALSLVLVALTPERRFEPRPRSRSRSRGSGRPSPEA